MATAWIFTLPMAGLVGAGGYALAHGIGGTAGVVVDLVILVAVAGTIYVRSRSTKVDHENVNAQWTGSVTPAAEPQPAAA
jgi:inorganic phosphate transporter, PiT family